MKHDQEPPIGAIENGREFLRRLEDHYDFSCDGGSLGNCQEFLEVKRCFEVMAAFISDGAEQ